MLTSITPLGEWGRGQRYAVTLIAFLLGCVAGGAAIGGSLGFAGSITLSAVGLGSADRLFLLSGLLALALLADTTGRRLPGPRRQVNERWLDRYRGWAYGVGFGFQLGLGVVTIVTTATVYLVPIAAFLSSDTDGGLIVGSTFGTVRGLTVLPSNRVRTPALLQEISQRLVEWQAPVHRFAVSMEASVAVVAAGAAIAAQLS